MLPPEVLPAAESALKTAKEYADVILRPSLEQIGGILSDTVASWRLKNQVRCVLKAKEFIEAKGLNPAKLMPDTFVPLLEAAGDVSDPELSEMFAQLLSTQLDPSKSDSAHPSFTKILGQMAPLDVKILKFIDERERAVNMDRDPYNQWMRQLVEIGDLRKVFQQQTETSLSLSVESLSRLGVICNGMRGLRGKILLTQFGCTFLAACSNSELRRSLFVDPMGLLDDDLDHYSKSLSELESDLRKRRNSAFPYE